LFTCCSIETRKRRAPEARLATDVIGWASAMILLLTLGRQAWLQWRERRTRGVSRWLFAGQIAASSGFVVYSWLLSNWVFVVTNALILLTAVAGEGIYLRNRRLESRGGPRAGATRE
jgi:MtN3 and saliva related transmembrane protein